jgi:protein involved in polysaccharide export with SLBB domain
VTPGDVYGLSFITAGGAVASSILVDSDYRVDLANLGRIDARGLRFAELRALVEKKVLAAYALSAPQLIVQSCGFFPVYLSGEVQKDGFVYLWGLSRLSELWGANLTPYASTRDIVVRSREGAERHYDLFRAWRDGDLSQDPYFRPFDTVTFARYDRSVAISGEVRRPGTYQLLPGEGFTELVQRYAEGFTAQANQARIGLTRLDPNGSGLGAKAQLSWEVAPSFPLLDKDAVSIPSLQELLPVAYFEGALGVGAEGAQLDAANRVPYTYYPGERLSQAVQALRRQFSAVSDLSGSYLLRGAERRPVNLEKLLYSKDFTQDFEFAAGDVIVVPFRQFFVSVSGAVKLPGRYPYVPDRGWEYYVNLAGGFDRDLNAREVIDIIDAGGKRWGKSRQIEPEDTIVAAANSFYYYLGKVTPIIGAIGAIITSVYYLSVML